MAKRPPAKPGPGHEALLLDLEATPNARSTMHLFDRMSLDADGQDRMDAARAYAACQTPTSSERALLNAAELRRRAKAFPEDEYTHYIEDLERAAETGQRWAPSRTIEPDTVPVVETYDPAPPHGYNYLRSPGPVVGDDPTPIDGLARLAPEFVTDDDRVIAEQYLPQLQQTTHAHAQDLRDQTPPAGNINEGDPVPEFPEPDQRFRSAVHIRDDHARWYE